MMKHFKIASIANNTHSNWWRDPGLRINVLHLAILYTVVYTLGYDGSNLNGLQIIPQFNEAYGSPSGIDLGLISAAYYLPKLPGAVLVAYLADKYGRRVTLYVGGVMMLAGAIVGCTSNSRSQLIGSRVMLGVGTTCGQITAALLLPELAHPRLRHFASSFFLPTFFLGSIASSWTTFSMIYFPATNSWAYRLPILLQGLGPVLLLLGVAFVPQSPRWLFKNGKTDEAHLILAKYHANGKMDDELVLAELEEIQNSLAFERESGSAGTYISFINTVSGRRRLGIIVIVGMSTQLSGSSIINYYLAPVLKQVGITKQSSVSGINGGLAISNWIFAMIGAALVEKIGRRKLVLTSFSSMLFFMILMTAISGAYAKTGIASVGVAIVPMIFCFMASYSFSMNPLPILYVPEISPTLLRAKSMAVLSLSQNLSQTFNQFANPVLLAAIKWEYYIVYVCTLITFLTLYYFFFRETRGLTVEQASLVYESDKFRTATSSKEESESEISEDGSEEEKQV